jgi:thioredoxin 1
MDGNKDKSPLVEIGEAKFTSEVLKAEQPVVVAFLASWSRPCQVLRPVLDEVAAACAEKVKIVLVNADDNPDLSMCFEIQSIPTLLYFVGSRLRGRLVGTASKEAILSHLQAVFQGKNFQSVTLDANNGEDEHRNP